MSRSMSQVPSLSCLVISRTPALLNRLLASLKAARSFWQPSDEVLCSWNGSAEAEQAINPWQDRCSDNQPSFRIAQRVSYHFSSNMNQLAEQAQGELLVLLNDDLVLDPGSLDRAIQIIQNQPDVGLVSGRLRSSTGLLTHGGVLFNNDYIPYNRYRPDDLGLLVDADGLAVHESGPMPAVTGALMVIRRSDFLALRFHTDYRVCGEDIALCLDLWSQLNKCAYYASDVTGIHDEKTTRGSTVDHYDIRKVAAYASTLIPNHAGLQAAGRRWATQESELMWKLVQQLRHELAQEHHQTKVARRNAEATVATLNEQQTQWEQRIAELNERVHAIEASSSWQLTAPLRQLGNKLKPTRQTDPHLSAELTTATAPLTLPTISVSPHPHNGNHNDNDNDNQTLHLIFDALILGQAHRATVSRGGIYRYASELLVALSRQANVGALLPYCPDPLLAGSVQQELEELERRFQVDLRPQPSAQEPAPLRSLPAPPARMKQLLKPLYRHWLHSPLVRAQAQRRLQSTMQGYPAQQTVFHTPFQSVPHEVRASALKAVAVTVHDMLPRIHPEFFTAETIRQFDGLLEQLQPSDHVICVSECTRRDFLRCHPKTPAEQVHVTPLAASPDLHPVRDSATLQAMRQQLGLRDRDLAILSLCTLEPRKNLSTLITAFEQLWRRSNGSDLKLVLAGSMGWKTTALTEQLRGSLAADAIMVTGHIPDNQLACLYSIADVFVYPSVYEGFGLPPLEAMQCGAPVIVGNTSSLPEVVGNAAQLVDPRSAASLEIALSTLLESSERREHARQAGLLQAAKFSWSRTAEQTAAVYRAILECHG